MIDKKALFNLGYGLYVVTTNDGKKDNGLILNSVMQVSNDSLAVSINKDNYSCDTVLNTKKLNVCPININAKFGLFKHFGFQSGRDVNKFESYNGPRSENGLIYLEDTFNSYISLEVKYPIDCGSHVLFICDIVESKVLNSVETMSYSYYHKNVKEKAKKNKGYVCQICGYVYEGETLPDDYVCPLCLHTAEYFEEIK